MSRIYKKLIDEEKSEPEVMPVRSRSHLQLMPPPPSARMLAPYFKKKARKSRSLIAGFVVMLVCGAGFAYRMKPGLFHLGEVTKKEVGQKALAKAAPLPKVVKSPEKIAEDTAQEKQAVLLYQKQNFSAAKQIFEQLVLLYPDSVELANNLAMTYFKLSEISQARKQFAQALKINRADPSTLNNIGSFHLAQRDFTQAIAYFKQAIANQPDLLEAHLNLGITYELAGNPLSSIPEYELYLAHPGINAALKPMLVKRLEKMKAFSAYYSKFSAEDLYD